MIEWSNLIDTIGLSDDWSVVYGLYLMMYDAQSNDSKHGI